MHDQAQFDKIDLHLIRVLHTVLVERSVSRAAMRLRMHQPAVSAALRKLRDISGDPLLVRTGGRLVPTTAGLMMVDPLANLLQSAEALFTEARRFDADSTTSTFKIAASDDLDPEFLPRVVTKIRSSAPFARIEIQPLAPDFNFQAELATGGLDTVIGSWMHPPEDLHIARLFADDLVSLVAADHPVLRMGWTPESWLESDHIAPTPSHPGAKSIVDEMLNGLGFQRSVAVQCAHYGSIPEMVASTNLVFTTLRQYCLRMAERFPLRVVECPIQLPRLVYSQLWHERSNGSSSARWLREVIRNVASTLGRRS